MIELGGQVYALDDPVVLAVLAGGATVLLILVLLVTTLRVAARSARATEPLAWRIEDLGRRVGDLSDGQERLSGGLGTVAQTQSQTLQLVETRLADVQREVNDRLHAATMANTRSLTEMQERMKESLQGSSEKTTKSLTELQERLRTIDRAQENITRLSGDVLSLQDILSNKQTRGAFGEIQLNDIVRKALPPDAFTMQATLSNGKRVDCLIHLPNPPGPIAIDSKFPLEAYEALRSAAAPDAQAAAARAFRTAVKKHISDIAARYLIPGETAEGALMFLPSEAVYAELHANFGELVRAGFDARVWIVSPTTCMATLNTMRAILKDARMREQAGEIRAALRLLHRDVELVVERAGKLETHFDQARKDLEGITVAAERAGKRAVRLDSFDFDEPGDALAAAKPLHEIS